MPRIFSSFNFILVHLISSSQYAWAVSLPNQLQDSTLNSPIMLELSFEAPTSRKLVQIIYQCLITILITTWLSTHPNLPGELLWYKRLWRRAKLWVWALLLPEVILLWSIRQMYAARKYAHKYKAQGWTTMHAHFLQMGGFVICDNLASQGGDVIRALSPPEFDALISSSLITFPSLSYRALLDKSKTHPLATLLGVVQGFWFVSNCIARADQGLSLTKPEVVTLGIVLLNAAIYFIWWNKPLDVNHPIQVYPKPFSEAPKGTLKLEVVTEEEPEDLNTLSRSKGYSTSGRSDIDVSTSSRTASTKAKSAFYVIISALFFPIYILVKLGSSLVRMLKLSKTSSPSSPTSPPYDQFYNRIVPMFYTSPLPFPRSFILAYYFGCGAYGSLHCIIAFSLPSPTFVETLLWKISTLCITGLPLLLLTLSILRPGLEGVILFIKRRGWRVPQQPKKVKAKLDKDLEGLFDTEPGQLTLGNSSKLTSGAFKNLSSPATNNTNNANTNTNADHLKNTPYHKEHAHFKSMSSPSTSSPPTPTPQPPIPTHLSRSSIPYIIISHLSKLITYSFISVYIIARLYVFFEAFVSLRAVPDHPGTLLQEARGWTRFIPHL